VRWLCRLHHEEQHAVMSAAACRTHCSVKELEPLASFRLRPATRARSPLTATVRQRQHDWPGTTPRR
jgi:hypothetical protein